MKKRISILMMLLMAAALLAGCVGTPVVYYTECDCPEDAHVATEVVETEEVETEADETATETTETVEETTDGAVKTGLAIVTDITGSENGVKADYAVTVVAVTVDDAGVIRDVCIDSIGATVEFDATGAITSDVNAEVLTKRELGDNYGMVAYAGTTYEWYQQADALEEYAIGKTVEELKTGAIDETGYAAEGTDLATTATIHLGGYVDAIEVAVNNAEHRGAQSGDELSLAITCGLSSSTGATEEKEGTAQFDCNAAAVTVNNGVITSCDIDSVQAKVNFGTDGVITTDLEAAVLTKGELGENYGMVAWGGAKYEWNEQADNFCAYVNGKTAEEVAGIAVSEGKPTDADLSAGVTISIADFQELIDKAIQ